MTLSTRRSSVPWTTSLRSAMLRLLTAGRPLVSRTYYAFQMPRAITDSYRVTVGDYTHLSRVNRSGRTQDSVALISGAHRSPRHHCHLVTDPRQHLPHAPAHRPVADAARAGNPEPASRHVAVRRLRRPEARPLADLSNSQSAELSDFRPSLTAV